MKRMDQIAELLYQVPRPPEDAIPSGVADVEIRQLEERTGITIPDLLRKWLSLTNGPCVGPGGFYGIHALRAHLDIEEVLTRFPNWKKRRWIPVAGDGCGNHYIIPTQKEFGNGYPVMFIDMERAVDSPSYVVASDLEHFIIGTLRKEMGDAGWPFNQETTLAFDPQLASFHSVPFPWEEPNA